MGIVALKWLKRLVIDREPGSPRAVRVKMKFVVAFNQTSSDTEYEHYDFLPNKVDKGLLKRQWLLALHVNNSTTFR